MEGLFFERTMSLFFGDKAYNIASEESSIRYRKEWLGRAAKRIIKRVNELDTTTRHKQLLMVESEKFLAATKSRKPDPWNLVYRLLRLCGRLLGFDFYRGSIVHTPVYHQTAGQHFTSIILAGGDAMQDYYDRKDAISIRKKVIENLKKEGFDHFKIALILNTTEYEVKKLSKNL